MIFSIRITYFERFVRIKYAALKAEIASSEKTYVNSELLSARFSIKRCAVFFEFLFYFLCTDFRIIDSTE